MKEYKEIIEYGKKLDRIQPEEIETKWGTYLYYPLPESEIENFEMDGDVFKILSIDPGSGKRVLLLGIRKKIGWELRQGLARTEIEKFKRIKSP